MLTCLRVRSFAIIDELEVEFGPGLNVVTGETGAGKSVLVRALELVLGARGRGDLVRAGDHRAEIEALFEGPGLRARLSNLGLEPDDQIVVRRTVLATGRSRATVNGRMATNAQLARLTAGLVDISSQHEHHTLVDPATHLAYLDAFAGFAAHRDELSEAFAATSAALAELREVRGRLSDRVGREDLLRYQVGEIEKVAPKAGEVEALEAEVQRLQHHSELTRTALGAEHALHGADASICSRIAQVVGDLERTARHDPALEALVEQVRSAATELEDAAVELGRYGRGIDADPERLIGAEERLEAVRRLTRRYGSTVEEVLAFAESARTELADLDDLDHAVAMAEQAFAAARDAAGQLARALSSERRGAARRLADAFADELHALGMGGAAVRVEVAPLEGTDTALQIDGARLSATGIDRVEFRIAPNPGSPPLPLGQVASGGELSRALLGLKRVLAGGGPEGLYVFDEVDTSVGGAVAEVIGRKIADVAAHHQVLCITHLPQIAAFAHRHLRVSKHITHDTTHTLVEVLDAPARLEELARMLGGLTITDTTRQAASEMVAAACGTVHRSEAP